MVDNMTLLFVILALILPLPAVPDPLSELIYPWRSDGTSW